MDTKSQLNDPKFMQKLPSGGPREYFTAAKAFLNRMHADWVEVRAKSEQHRAWFAYFRHKGWRLRFIERLGTKGYPDMTVLPAEWPEVFDGNYEAATCSVILPADADQDDEDTAVERAPRKSYAELNRKYGDGRGGWGIIPARPERAHPGLTARELEAMVGEEEWRKIPDLPDSPRNWKKPGLSR